MEQPGETTNLSLQADLGEFFRQIVDETSDHEPRQLDQPVKQYVVGLLEDAAQTPSPVTAAVERPFALLLADAMAAEPAERFQRLRQTGDGILLVGGLYRGHLAKAGLEDRYVVAVGSRAYQSASSLLDFSGGGLRVGDSSPYDILGTLAQGFFELMVFLRHVADTIVAKAARSAHDLAKLCEMWLTDRSAHLGRLLRARGVILDGVTLSGN